MNAVFTEPNSYEIIKSNYISIVRMVSKRVDKLVVQRVALSVAPRYSQVPP